MHTKGQWFVNNELRNDQRVHYVVLSDTGTITLGEPDPTWIADCGGFGQSWDNARLIAAAPAMLAALKAISAEGPKDMPEDDMGEPMTDGGEYAWNSGHTRAQYEMACIARAAIIQAEGGSDYYE